MIKFLQQLWDDESGIAAVEYALITGLMAALIVVVWSLFGENLRELFSAISETLGEQAENIRNESLP